MMSCKPLISGVLFNLGASIFGDNSYIYKQSKAQWQQELDELQKVGIDMLYIFKGVNYCMNRTACAASDLLEFLFTECNERRMNVIVSAGDSGNRWGETDLDSEVEFMNSSIEEIYVRYGKYPSFYGWYIPRETWVRRGEDVKVYRNYSKRIVDKCKNLTPGLPVSISPFFMPDAAGNGDYVYGEPSEYVDYWSDLLDYSGIEILALQDNGGQHLSCFTEKDTLPFIEAIAMACQNTGTRFWGNVETGEFPVADVDGFARRFGVKDHVNNPALYHFWRGVSISRLIRKLELMSKFSERNVSWGFREFYRPSTGGTAKANYDAYYNYYQGICSKGSNLMYQPTGAAQRIC